MYGDNTAALRSELATLLQITRNQQGLDTLTPDDVALIASFRTSLTLWCQQAVRASNPDGDFGGATPRSRGPAEELRHRLDQARTAYTAPLPALDQPATPHPNHIVDQWRRAAKAAALGEHDFPAGLDYGALTERQAMTVLKDSAEVARALTGLDRHYSGAVPDWEPITDAELLGRAAVVCAAHAGYDKPDYSVDQRGWRPPVQLVDGPALPGLDGVLQAQNNLLVHLRHQPDAYSLRLIFDSQRIVSARAAVIGNRAGTPVPVAERWLRRSDTYRLLIDQTRNLRGLVGTGHAAGQGALAAARIRDLPPSDRPRFQQLRHLDALFIHIDQRLAETIAAGADDRSYLMRVDLPRIDLSEPGAVKPPRARHVPLDVQPRTPVLDTVKNRLTPRPTSPACSPGSTTQRRSFTGAIDAARRSAPKSSDLSL
ncbi:hypothetical protein [Aeromicrobium piscarium]|uniref:Uncharacterized protein n=1 Tax=Aeromicrobium piscarium TaxID=2590901 RepID=A0A554SHC6_9ACTN|nr:hypothetical protein [Aeromicrobium piscarium]TSD65745.1 hypothetical protein FNM00_04820 [Aeromicrobium piscarium]